MSKQAAAEPAPPTLKPQAPAKEAPPKQERPKPAPAGRPAAEAPKPKAEAVEPPAAKPQPAAPKKHASSCERLLLPLLVHSGLNTIFRRLPYHAPTTLYLITPQTKQPASPATAPPSPT